LSSPSNAVLPKARAELPIAVFDSGVGGLTVLEALRRRLPAEDLLYLGDTARVPYGTRSPDTVVRYASRVAGHLWSRGIKALVVACNTATSWALEKLEIEGRRRGIPVLGVIEPGVDKALAVTTTGRIGVIGTEGTIRGGRYEALLRAKRPDVEVISTPCPLFVALAEEGWTEGPVLDLVADRYLAPLRGRVDTLVLGCTHYPLLRAGIAKALPGVTLVDSATSMAEAVARALPPLGLVARRASGTMTLLATDNRERFQALGERFLEEPIEDVEIVDLEAGDEWLEHLRAAGA
jgi:glutamate racemase